MYKNKKISALILMGGTGSRFNSSTPKQFHKILKKEIFLYTLETFQETKVFDEIILVCHKNYIQKVKKSIKNFSSIKIIAAGNNRQSSSFKGLLSCNSPDIVVIHDAIRPFISKKIILNNIKIAITKGAVNTCIKATDTIVKIKNNKIIDIPKRKDLFQGQTPQTFQYKIILKAHKNAKIKNATDDCSLVKDIKKDIYITPGDIFNIKITTKFDLIIAKEILSKKILKSFIKRI